MHSCFSCPVPWIYLLMNISLKYFDDLIKVLLKIVQLHCNSSKRGGAAWLPFPFCTGSEAGQELPPSVLDNPVSWHQFPANSAILQDPPTFPLHQSPRRGQWCGVALPSCLPVLTMPWMNERKFSFPTLSFAPGMSCIWVCEGRAEDGLWSESHVPSASPFPRRVSTALVQPPPRTPPVRTPRLSEPSCSARGLAASTHWCLPAPAITLITPRALMATVGFLTSPLFSPHRWKKELNPWASSWRSDTPDKGLGAAREAPGPSLCPPSSSWSKAMPCHVPKLAMRTKNPGKDVNRVAEMQRSSPWGLRGLVRAVPSLLGGFPRWGSHPTRQLRSLSHSALSA